MSDPQPRSVARLLACFVLGGLLGGWAHGVRAGPTLSADIPPQPVAGALAEFARQTGLQFIYVSSIARARKSPGAPAGLAPAAALPMLLDGTGLGFEYLNSRTVRIFDTPAVPAAPLPAAEVSRAPVKDRTPDADKSEEIIVTGTRGLHAFGDPEDVQHVAASMSVASGDTLEAQKLGQLGDFGAYLPALNMDTGGVPSFFAVQLRGIGDASSPMVAYYIDDTPIRPSWLSNGLAWPTPDLMPYDLKRIEVRRGPQGTLGGAGSEVGLIRYVMNEPNVSEFDANVGTDVSTTRYASQPGTSVQGMVNVPIVKDVLAIRASGYDVYTPGFIDNVNVHAEAKDVNAQRNYGGRITALWYPADSLTVKVTAFWNRIDADSNDFVMWTGPATAVDAGDANIYKVSKSWNHFITDAAFLPSYQSDISFCSATLNWNPGSLEIVSATTWSRDEVHTVNDSTPYTGAYFPELGDGTIAAGLSNLQQDANLDKFSEEIDITSSRRGAVEWLLGGFYTNEHLTDRLSEYGFDYNFRPITALAPAIWFQVVPSTFQSWAVFGDLTWRVNDQLDLTGGIRYDHNDQAMSALVAGATYDEPVAFSNRYSGGSTTWMATARYHFTPDVMLYASVATGSTPGGMNDPGIPPVKADSLISYEAGLKSGFLDGKGMVDLTAFYIDWKDIQLQEHVGWSFINGGKAVSQGVELTSSFAPVYALRLGFNAAYTRAEFTRLVPAVQYLMAGYQFPQVPKWGMSVTADYDWSLTDAWHAHIGGACRWIGPQWSLQVYSRSHDGAPTVELPTYSILDLNASIARGSLTLEVFARNLEDTQASRHGHFGVDTSGAVAIAGAEDVMVQPRTIGVGIEYSF